MHLTPPPPPGFPYQWINPILSSDRENWGVMEGRGKSNRLGTSWGNFKILTNSIKSVVDICTFSKIKNYIQPTPLHSVTVCGDPQREHE
jgi:hypothetical protein